MISQGERCREDVGGGWQHTRQTLEKSATSNLYTTWAHILSDGNVFAPRGEGENGGSNALRAFLVFVCCHNSLAGSSVNMLFDAKTSITLRSLLLVGCFSGLSTTSISVYCSLIRCNLWLDYGIYSTVLCLNSEVGRV